MSNDIINSREFLDIIDSDVLENVICFNRFIVNYFYRNPDQNLIARLDDSSNINEDIIRCFKGFSVNFGDTFSSVSNYIVFIEPDSDPIENYRKCVSKYIPLGKNATHVCVMSEDLVEVERIYSILVKENPNLRLVQKTSVFNYSEQSLQKAKDLIKDESRMFIIKDYCESLSSIYNGSDITFIKEFKRVVDEIDSLCTNKFIIFGGDQQTHSYFIFKLILVELYNRGSKCKFYIDVYDTTEVLTQLSASVFSPESMLVEDVVKFLLNLPDLVAELKEDYLVYHLINSRHLNLKVSYAPLNSLNKESVKSKVLRSEDMKIMPFSNYYNMCTDSFYTNIRTEKECRQFIHSLYDVFTLPNDEILSVTNVFFFIMDDVEYVGYCRAYDFKAPCVSNMIGMMATRFSLGFNDIRRLCYLDSCLNAGSILKQFQLFSTAKTLNSKSIIPYKSFRKYSSIYRVYSVNNNYSFTGIVDSNSHGDYWVDMPESIFNCGMYSPMSTKFRGGLFMSLFKILDTESRYLLDSFGGFNLVTNPSIELSMKRNSAK